MNKIAGGIYAIFGALAMTSCGHGTQQQAVTGARETQNAKAPAANKAGSPQMIDASVIAAAKPTGQPCSLDTVDGSYAKQVRVTAGKPHVFRGWLLDASRKPAGKFSLILEGKQDFAIVAVTGVSRPDVGAYLRDPKLDEAGFEFVSAFTAIPPGEYKLVLLVDHRSAAHSCDVEKRLTVE